MAALTESLRLMRPRTIAQISKTAAEAAEQTRELKSTVKALSVGLGQGERLERAIEELSVQLRTMQESLDQRLKAVADELQVARLKESQLRAVMQRDLELEGKDADFRKQMKDFDGITQHVREAFGRAELLDEPFPYMVVDDVLPQWLWDALITALPPTELYGDRDVNRQQLTVPFDLAPRYSQLVWKFMTQTVVDHVLRPVMVERFAPALHAFLRDTFPTVDRTAIAELPIKCSEGRIMYRRRGYYIKPHRDPKWGMITGILYLAKPEDDPRWGTDLFTVDNDVKAPSLTPYWIKEERCHHVRLVENKPNRLLIFLNSKGAHGARIPPELTEVDVERSIYQFKLTPRTAGMKMLIDSLPEDERRTWLGKVSDY